MKTTRSELFELVWAKPLVRVARQLGVSDTALRKVCKRHNLPVPARGHWQRLASGHQRAPVALPDGPDVDIDIGGPSDGASGLRRSEPAAARELSAAEPGPSPSSRSRHRDARPPAKRSGTSADLTLGTEAAPKPAGMDSSTWIHRDVSIDMFLLELDAEVWLRHHSLKMAYAAVAAAVASSPQVNDPHCIAWLQALHAAVMSRAPATGQWAAIRLNRGLKKK